FLGVELIKLNDGIVKIAVAVIVVILNYFFTKFVFKNKDEKKNIEKNTNVKKKETKGLENNEIWYKKWYVIYTALFFITCFLLFFGFIIRGKSFVWNSDGFHQHFPSAIYLGNYFRDIIINIFKNHEIVIPMWDLTIGTGLDVFTTLNYYAFGDPLNVFYIFTPEKYTAYMYSFLVILRLYLSGLFFILFCFNFKQKKMPSILGALGYAFCGYALFASIRHPFFVNPMIYLPLILLGIEYVFKGKKPYLFILMIVISAISNFYFLYMLTIAAVLYTFVRVLYLYNDKGMFLKKFLHYLLKFAIYYIIAILLSAVLFLPIITAFLSSARASGQSANIDILFNIFYYVNFFQNIFNSVSIGYYWTILGFNVVMVMSALLIFKDKSKNGKYFKIMLAISFIGLLIPIVGYIMNGFSYVSNRWCFIFAFIMAFISVYILSNLRSLLVKNTKYLLISLLIIIAINIVLDGIYIFIEGNNKIYVYNYIFVLMGIVLIACSDSKKIINKNNWFILITAIFVIQIFMSGFLLYSKSSYNYVGDFLSYSRLSKEIDQKKFRFIKDYDESNIYRVDYTNNKYNYGFLNKVNGVSTFFSLSNKYVPEYLFDLSILGNVTYTGNHGYDNRMVSNTLKGVKYLIADDYYFTDMYKDYKQIKKYSDLSIYENTNALDLFYTYDSVINKEQFNKLDVNDKEYAMLQSVYLNDSDFIKPESVTSSSKTIMTFEDILKNAKYDKDKIEIKNDKIVVKESNATIKLNLGEINNSECYFVINNLDINLARKLNNDASLDKKIKYYLSDDPKTSYIRFDVDNQGRFDRKYLIRSKEQTYYIGKQSYIFNLGYLESGNHNVDVKITQKGTYFISDMKVICQPKDDYDKYVNELKKDKVENFKIKGNTVSLNVNTKENKIGVLSIPYSKGWKAYVNGKEVEVLQANIDSMGVELQKGENEVV
ncbi:YfhO family protein, partial [Anaerofustis butyriciformans]|uniref:YfhO family protein n=1 Tax=Anaerofustis butyriciformans TaxID=3108533 RepID=UPI003F89F53B